MRLGFFISPSDLWSRIGTADTPRILDVRRRDAYEAATGIIPASEWFDPAAGDGWMQAVDRSRPIVAACKAGHELSQMVAATLRQQGLAASVLAGGYAGWAEGGLPLVDKAAVSRFAPRRPSAWVTRRRPKIDRVACPWLIRRFIDAEARILFVDPSEVPDVARESGAVPFDIEGIELSHEGPRCTFDTMLKLFGLEAEPSLAHLALIVRGADTARPDLAPEAAGLHAVSLGLSALAGDDDHALLPQGFAVYDALFAWLRFAAEERHNWPAPISGIPEIGTLNAQVGNSRLAGAA
ncbi:MAG: sulfurtransferase [Rhizobiales bacterium]|nr:sulfurtransferase [Hyphomicrobiales bacterium]